MVVAPIPLIIVIFPFGGGVPLVLPLECLPKDVQWVRMGLKVEWMQIGPREQSRRWAQGSRVGMGGPCLRHSQGFQGIMLEQWWHRLSNRYLDLHLWMSQDTAGHSKPPVVTRVFTPPSHLVLNPGLAHVAH